MGLTANVRYPSRWREEKVKRGFFFFFFFFFKKKKNPTTLAEMRNWWVCQGRGPKHTAG